MDDKKYKIIFDSNIVFCDEQSELGKVFNSIPEDIFNFIKSNNITGIELCLPQIVIDERVSWRLRQIQEQFDAMNIATRNLRTFSIFKIREKKFDFAEYKKILNKVALKQIKKLNIKKIVTTEVNQEVVIKRALQKKAPFYAKGKSDHGFKDTMIWLSILSDAKKNKNCKYILLTNDGNGFDQDICKKEFEEYNQKDLLIISDVSKLKEFLDVEFELSLDLKAEFDIVKDEIMRKIGELMVAVNNNEEDMMMDAYGGRNYFRPLKLNTINTGMNNDVVGYDFERINFEDISKISSKDFKLVVTISAKKRYKDDDLYIRFKDYRSGPLFSFDGDEEAFNLVMEYDKDTKDIKINTVTKQYQNIYTDKELYNKYLYSVKNTNRNILPNKKV